jgi:hypothetical protein
MVLLHWECSCHTTDSPVSLACAAVKLLCPCRLPLQSRKCCTCCFDTCCCWCSCCNTTCQVHLARLYMPSSASSASPPLLAILATATDTTACLSTALCPRAGSTCQPPARSFCHDQLDDTCCCCCCCRKCPHVNILYHHAPSLAPLATPSEVNHNQLDDTSDCCCCCCKRPHAF